MIRNLSKLLMALCLLAAGGGVVANAQAEQPAIIEANVSHAFLVGNATLPPGKYEVRRIDDTNPNVSEIRSADGRTAVVFETEDAQLRDDQPASKTELVFNKIGNQYFLSQVWVAGSLNGRELAKSKMEKKLADGGSQAERHSIVALEKHSKR
jgi:hypothetical protein